MNKLSIIMPCYNCAETLKEAFESIYTQNLNLPFEVVMVDDGSTDNTRKLIIDLSLKYKEVKYFFHEKNKGGGAARNTAVDGSSGDIIFCLDSDDILGENVLNRMVDTILNKKCDGVGISTSIKFSGKNKDDIVNIHNLGQPGKVINFEDLLENNDKFCSLYSTFLITKKAFYLAGGYPTNHGFDTQGMAWRFLSKGLVAYTCPNTIYFHRVNYKKTYYLREYESGRANYNWFKIFEENIFLFNEEIQKEILFFNYKEFNTNLYSYICAKPNILRLDYEKFININGMYLFVKNVLKDKHFSDTNLYILGLYYLKIKQFEKSLYYFKKIKIKNNIIEYKINLIFLFMNGWEYIKAEKYLDSKIKFRGKNHPFSLISRLLNKIKLCLQII